MENKPYKPREFHHKRSLGQNFLTDESTLSQLVALSGVGAHDNVLEIGAGAGDLTKRLSISAQKVIAIEIDQALIPILRVALEKCGNVTLIEGDAMRLNLPEITRELGEFAVVANIPYYLTTDLLMLLMASSMPITSISVMVQREAAERIIATPGGKNYGMLAVRAQYLFEPQIALDVPRALFTPPPHVDSAFVVMPRRAQKPYQVEDEALFFRIAASAFAMRRKTMLNNLMTAFHLPRETASEWLGNAGFNENVRGETLSGEQFALLANACPEALKKSE